MDVLIGSHVFGSIYEYTAMLRHWLFLQHVTAFERAILNYLLAEKGKELRVRGHRPQLG